MAVFSIKDPLTDSQARVINGILQTSGGGGGGGGDTNIFDSAGNPLNSTNSSLNVYPIVGWANFGQGTPDTVNVMDTSTPLLLANPLRLYASFTNNSTQSVYMQYQVAAVWKRGEVLRPNQTSVIDATCLFLGQVNAITDTGAPSVDIDVKEGVL